MTPFWLRSGARSIGPAAAAHAGRPRPRIRDELAERVEREVDGRKLVRRLDSHTDLAKRPAERVGDLRMRAHPRRQPRPAGLRAERRAEERIEDEPGRPGVELGVEGADRAV